MLATKRDPESFVARGVAIDRDGPRYSNDIDIFHDVAARLAATSEADVAVLKEAGLQVDTVRPSSPELRRAMVSGHDEHTEIDWVFDSDFRYFPAIPDDEFGYVLHPVDLAINKASAAASRRVARDIYDLVTIDRDILPLGAVLCAAVGRFPGPTPEEMLDDITRNSRFTPTDYEALSTEHPVNPAATYAAIKAMIERARSFIRSMPSDAVGVVFLDHHEPVAPDPSRLGPISDMAAGDAATGRPAHR